jgi:hypothetical protein
MPVRRLGSLPLRHAPRGVRSTGDNLTSPERHRPRGPQIGDKLCRFCCRVFAAHEHRRARHAHDRRARRSRCRRGPGSSRRAQPPGSRSRSSATSRGSGRRSAPAACACRGRGNAQAPGRLHDDRRRRDGREDRSQLREGRRRPELDARVHPRQPPARLPRLRQGRRVPAPGPDLPLRARLDAHDLRQEDAREADPDLADDRPRPRALHPLLPLHALLRGRRRGRRARRDQPRRALDDRHLRGRALPRHLLRQRDRALPGRRADLDAVPLRGAARGRSRTSRPSAGTAPSAATSTRPRARGR